MYYQTATARNLAPQPQQEERPQTHLHVIRGGCADRAVREGINPRFVTLLKVAVYALLVFIALGSIRVLITTKTVTQLQHNMQMRETIQIAELNNSELRIERSIMSSKSRIVRIATENYGMVPATEFDIISLPCQDDKTTTLIQQVETATGSHATRLLNTEAETAN